MPTLAERLNTPMKRAASVAFFVGAAWLVAGSIYASDKSNSYDLEMWWEVVTNTHFNARRYWYIAYSTYLAAAGLALSFAYDMGLGIVVKWIRGQAPDDSPRQ